MNKPTLEGKKVYIKENIKSWAAGEWGIINKVIGDEYHIGLAGSTTQSLVFSRREFTLAK